MRHINSINSSNSPLHRIQTALNSFSLPPGLNEPNHIVLPDTRVIERNHRRETLLAALNGVIGDSLAYSGSQLAIPMQFIHQEQPLISDGGLITSPVGVPQRKILLLVHGLCMSDLQWQQTNQSGAKRNGRRIQAQPTDTDLSASSQCAYESMAADTHHTLLMLRYNSGLHISSNGQHLSSLLQSLLSSWPVPINEITIIANSMGGLVTRSACFYAERLNHNWLEKLRKIIFLGTPHHGAPLERYGNRVDSFLSARSYTARLARIGKIRSAGITDLRYGNLIDEDWHSHDRFHAKGDTRRPIPLPTGVRCYTIAATTGYHRGDFRDRLFGDGLVPLQSALGKHDFSSFNLNFESNKQWIAFATTHLGLLRQEKVFNKVKHWLLDKQ